MQDLKQHIAHSIFWNYATAFGSQFVSLLGSIILTSLLTPDDFGVMAFAIIVLGVWGLFIGQGYAQAIVQSKEVNNNALNTIFWINLAVGLGTLSISYFVGSFLSSFFEIDHFGWYLFLFSISSTIDSFNVVQSSILHRNMKFKETGIALLIANIVSLVVAIIMALNDYGVYSLIAKTVLLSGVSCLIIWYYTGWRPSFAFSRSSLSTIHSFSRDIFYNNLIQFSSNKFDRIIITKLLGTADLGIYNRANTFTVSIARLIKSKTGQVAYSALSKLTSGKLFNEYYFHMVLLFNTLIAPMILVILLSSKELIGMYLSQEWTDLVPIMQIIGLASIVFISGMPIRMLMAIGEGQLIVKTSIITALLKIAVLSIAFFIAPKLQTLVLFFMGANMIDSLIKNYVSYRHTKMELYDIVKYQLLPPFITIITFLIALLLDDYLTGSLWMKAFIKVIMGLSLFGTLYYMIYRDFLPKALSLITESKNRK